MPTGKVDRNKIREDIDTDKENNGGNGNGTIVFFEPREGENEIRILPPPPGQTSPFVKTATHFNVGPEKKILNAPVDSKGRVGGWLQAKAAELADSDDDVAKELASSLWARKRWLYNIVDLNHLEAGIQVMSVGIQAHSQIAAYIYDKDDDYGDITDPVEGYNLVFTVTDKGKLTAKYDVRCKPKSKPLPEEILALLEEQDPYDLTKLRPAASDADMEKAFYGEIVEADDMPEDDPAPVVVRKRQEASDEEEDAPVRRQFGSKLHKQ